MQHPAAGRGSRRRDHRLVAAQRHPRQRVKRPDPGWIKHTSDLDQGVRGAAGQRGPRGRLHGVRGHRPVLAVLVVHGDLKRAAGVPDRRGVDLLTWCQRPGLSALVVHRADGPVAGDGSASEGAPCCGLERAGPKPLEHGGVGLLGRGAHGGHRAAGSRGLHARPASVHVRHRRRCRELLHGGLRVLVHAAGGGGQYRQLHTAVNAGVLLQVTAGDNRLVQPVQLRLGVAGRWPRSAPGWSS